MLNLLWEKIIIISLKRLQIASIWYFDFNILSIQDEILFDVPNDLEIFW